MVQKILVTGATGFIGIEVSRQLAARGMRPRLMVRRPVRGLMLRNLDADIMQADIRSPKSLDRILKGMDTVIHLGARAAFEPYPRLYPSIVKGSVNLMQAAIKAGVKNFVFGGSLLVYGDRTQPIDQQTATCTGVRLRTGQARGRTAPGRAGRNGRHLLCIFAPAACLRGPQPFV